MRALRHVGGERLYIMTKSTDVEEHMIAFGFHFRASVSTFDIGFFL